MACENPAAGIGKTEATGGRVLDLGHERSRQAFQGWPETTHPLRCHLSGWQAVFRA